MKKSIIKENNQNSRRGSRAEAGTAAAGTAGTEMAAEGVRKGAGKVVEGEA